MMSSRITEDYGATSTAVTELVSGTGSSDGLSDRDMGWDYEYNTLLMTQVTCMDTSCEAKSPEPWVAAGSP